MSNLESDLRAFIDAVAPPIALSSVQSPEPGQSYVPIWRRRLGFAAAVATIIAVLVVPAVILRHSGGSQRSHVISNGGVSSTLVFLQPTPTPSLISSDEKTGTTHSLALPANNYLDYPSYGALRLNDQVVVAIPGGIGIAPADLSTPVVKISNAEYFVPGSESGRLWVVYRQSSIQPGQEIVSTPPLVEEIALDGTVVVQRRRLPDGSGEPITGVSDGLLIRTGVGSTRAASDLTLWDPNTATSLWTIPSAGDTVIAATSRVVAFASDCSPAPTDGCTRVQVVDVASGRIAFTKDLASGVYAHAGFSPGAFSSDGHTLAVLTQRASRIAVAFLDVVSARANDVVVSTDVPSAEVTSPATLAWAANGRYVLVGILGSAVQQVSPSESRPSVIGTASAAILVPTRG